MSQGEETGSAEAGGDDDGIAVWPWVEPKRGGTGGVDRSQGQVWLVPSQVSWVDIEGHLLRLHAVTGEVFARRGTLKSLEQRWAASGFVRIHNLFLVFLPHVQPVPTSRGREVYLSSGANARYFPVSRRRWPQVKQALKNRE